MTKIRNLLLESFAVAYSAAHPQKALSGFSFEPPKGRVIVIGAGKASAMMAAAFEESYDGPVEGVVVTRYGFGVPTKHIEILEAAHPVPDEAGVAAVQKIMDALEQTTADDLVICLISGGGSSLLSAPVDGVSLEELQQLNAALLKSGARIQDMNDVRKHVNIALGGGLAKRAPDTPMLTLAISDVTGDDPASIASGPTVADPSTLKEARAVLTKYEIDVPSAIEAALDNPANETLKPGDVALANKDYRLIATPTKALKEASAYWAAQGFTPYIMDAEMEGDTNDCAALHIAEIKKIIEGEHKIKPPCALLSGGETTVKITGNGQGGPNTQFMLQAAILLEGNTKVFGLAGDTDGIDGNADNAGAIITPETLIRAKNEGLDAQQFLENNDSYGFFNTIDGLVKTGPTHTNVNDYRVFLLLP